MGLTVYDFGGGGVNIVKDPLQMADNEATQLQNAEYEADSTTGGQGALRKRDGIQALNSSAMSGAVSGAIALPLQTTYVRTLLASLGEYAANTFTSTPDGSVWTPTPTPYAAARWDNANYETTGSQSQSGQRRGCVYRNLIIYPGNDYVADQSTPGNTTALPIVSWDGTNKVELFRMTVGSTSSDGNLPFNVTDMIQANGIIYFAVMDPTAAATFKGRVLAYDPANATVTQVASGFSGNSGDVTGGVPGCLAFHQGQLFVGLNQGNGTANIGQVVRCYPGISTSWTTDVSNLPGYPKEFCVYNGDLYAGLHGNATNDAAIYKRSQSTGAWTSSDTISTSGLDYYGGLVVYGGSLYATVYSDGGADILEIKSFDGTTWSNERDVAANDCSGGIAQQVGGGLVFGSDLYLAFKSTQYNLNDGFILQKHNGSWSKVLTANINGRLFTLTVRS